ncbi:MAG: radical SAM protein [Candidatus Aminicenantes bacterium]|jgi:oxygen-independent coproporphyrinogen-3 oxidase
MKNNQEFTLLFQPPISMHIIEEQKNSFLRKHISIYIHIPFCEEKCFYCSIETCQEYTDDDIDNYVSGLEKEIIYYQDYFKINKIDCIHFGGGTPSLLKEEQIERLFKALEACIPDFDQVEIVFECHPLSLSNSKIDYLSQTGRVSINLGVQTFHDKILKIINRCSSEQIYNCLSQISKKKFRTVGIDLICNLPYSDPGTTISDIDMAIHLNINHLALYPLRIEPNSIFYDYYSRYREGFVRKDKQIIILSNAAEYLRNKGYDHYSIYYFSNQKETTYLYSRNQMYGGEWIGLGVGAYSSYNGYVFANTNDISEYIKLCNLKHSCVKFQEEYNAIKNIIWEFVFSLRIRNISKQYYLEKYDEVIYKMLFSPILKYLLKNDYMNETSSGFQLAERGIINLANIENDILDNYEKIILCSNETIQAH